MPFGNSGLESQRDSIIQPRVATTGLAVVQRRREELPWVNALTMIYPNGVASSPRFVANLNFRKALSLSHFPLAGQKLAAVCKSVCTRTPKADATPARNSNFRLKETPSWHGQSGIKSWLNRGRQCCSAKHLPCGCPNPSRRPAPPGPSANERQIVRFFMPPSPSRFHLERWAVHPDMLQQNPVQTDA